MFKESVKLARISAVQAEETGMWILGKEVDEMQVIDINISALVIGHNNIDDESIKVLAHHSYINLN